MATGVTAGGMFAEGYDGDGCRGAGPDTKLGSHGVSNRGRRQTVQDIFCSGMTTASRSS
jgi:hypothetical protein